MSIDPSNFNAREITTITDIGAATTNDQLLAVRGGVAALVRGLDVTKLNGIETGATKNEKATPTEYFNKNPNSFATPELIANDVRLTKFSVGNSVAGLSVAVAAGGTYNLLTAFLGASETQNGNIPVVYKNTANATQLTLLNEATDRFLFFSPQNTLNQTYYNVRFRVQVTYNITTTVNQATIFYIRLRRFVDNSIVPAGTIQGTQHNAVARTGETIDGAILSFVSGETDPFVLNGCYLSLDNDSVSSDTLTITGINIRLFID